MSIDFNLENKTILVTGASSGIGKSIAINASKAGAKLVILGRNIDTLEETKSLCPGEVIPIQCDLTEIDKLTKLVRNIASEQGAFSGMVHCAGISQICPLRAIRPKMIEQTLAINSIAPIMLAKGIALQKNPDKIPASIVLISSVMGHVGQPGMTIYSMTKGAVEQAAKSLALELLPSNIRVNTIAPATIKTPMAQKSFDKLTPEEIENIMRVHPAGLGTPEDVAAAAIYLLSDASKYVTGTSIKVDGGYCAQ